MPKVPKVVGLPDSAGMMTATPDVGFAVSPGGDFVVYETVRQGRSELWYRSLLDATVRRIPGTDDGSQPAISPDGNRIAFFHLTDGGWTVEVIPVEGGTATTIGRGVGVLRRLLWATGGRILAIDSNGAVARWLDPERGPVSSVRIRYCEDEALIPGRGGLLCGGGASKWGYRVTVEDTTFEQRFWRSDRSYDFGLVALFANPAALERYQNHPEHLPVVEKVKAMCATVVTVDFYGSDASASDAGPPPWDRDPFEKLKL